MPSDIYKINTDSRLEPFRLDGVPSTGSVSIPSQSYTALQIRKFSFTIPITATSSLSPTQVYLNFSYDTSNWLVLSTFVETNTPQGMLLRMSSTYSTGAITISIEVQNTTVGTLSLTAFDIAGKAHFFIAPW